MSILNQLLHRMREYQSYCPYCGGEHVCEADCVLDGIWFKRVEDDHADYCKCSNQKEHEEACDGKCW